MSFDHLGLRPELLKAVAKKGYEAPTEIQARAIPVILGGRDILARAQTGTGKTEAFALPIVEILSGSHGNGHHPRALVLTPPRELALQVGEVIKAYARKVSLRCTVVFGGVRIEAQIERLRRGIDILVATPGRLLDLAAQDQLNLALVEFLVFDEADRMLDLGFSREIGQILDLLPEDRRTMLFSATYSPQIRALASRMLKNPEHVEIRPEVLTADSVTQKVHHVERDMKLPLLLHLIDRHQGGRILVFARTRTWANRLTDKIAAHGVNVAALHGSKSQSLRKRTLEEFKAGEIHVLVATDVAARGLDISDLPLVVNYDMPGFPEEYVHRIGRTGRAGHSGVAVSLVCPEEHDLLAAIEKALGRKIPVEAVKGYTQDSDIPDGVLYRPGNPGRDKKAPKAIKVLVAVSKGAKLPVRGKGPKPAGDGSSRKRSDSGKPGKPGETAGGKARSPKAGRSDDRGGKPKAGGTGGKPKTGGTGGKPGSPASRPAKPAKPGRGRAGR
jgi:ATP-dependent RNA helicase RhlE